MFPIWSCRILASASTYEKICSSCHIETMRAASSHLKCPQSLFVPILFNLLFSSHLLELLFLEIRRASLKWIFSAPCLFSLYFYYFSLFSPSLSSIHCIAGSTVYL